jgi:DNA ligase-1
MKLPTLYKKTSTGAIQFWEISVKETTVERPIGTMYGVGLITTKYGQLDTDSPQITEDAVLFGKNEGKKNETTALQQAEKEAQSKWEKQLKRGYVTSIESAKAGEIDRLIEGGISPMLAHKFSDHGNKIKYPSYIQPKLDGIRCIAIIKDRKCTLWSRTRKPITSMPHIVAEIESHFIADIILDGELYNQEFKNNFEHIVHLVRQEDPDPQHTDVQYHIYDLVNEDTFQKRNSRLNKIFTIGDPKLKYLVKVHTSTIHDESEVTGIFNLLRDSGYEGAMLRNADGLYVNKRSYDLQKVKEFEDNEFEIIGIEEGRGKLIGHVGAFILKTESGKEFIAKMSGDTEKLKEYFEDHSTWKGKKLTVQYQGLTGKENVPRFPVGIAIRDYE